MTRLTIRIDFDAQRSLGHGKIRLLEMVDRYGSIASAARAMAMSYRRAWLLVDEINHMFTEPAIATQLGGRGGGSAKLTDFGRLLIATYRGIETQSGATYAPALVELERRLAPVLSP